MARRPRGTTRTSRLIAVAAVTVLAVGAIALAAAALQHGNPDTPVGTPSPAPTFDLGVETGTSETPAAPLPAPGPAAPGAAERFLSVGSGGMWRATAGDCAVTPPLVERSMDGGETWTDVTPLYRGIGQVRGLVAFAETEAEMLADMGDECNLELLRTFTQGRFWESYPEVLAASTYLAAEDPRVVITPEGEIQAPCDDPWSMRTSADTYALICKGTAYRLAEGEWATLTDANAVALAIANDDVLVAHSDPECPELAVSRFGAERTPIGCVDSIDSMPIALAALGDKIVSWSGGRIATIDG